MSTRTTRKRGLQPPARAETPRNAATTEISEDEQWRLIHESGILSKTTPIPKPSTEEDSTPLAEEIFGAVILIIPFSFLLLMMEILIHFQYGKRPSLQALIDRMASGIPILSIFTFYTTRFKEKPKMQIFLYTLSVLAGSRLIYLMNLGSWLVNMQQCPPLATIWVYTVVQLNLGLAVAALVTVAIYVWCAGLQMLP